MLDKPADRAEAATHLRRLSGKRHELISAAVMAIDGRPVWRVVDRAKMHVRLLSDAFIESYLDQEWPEIAGCVGCYRIEGPGTQLFPGSRAVSSLCWVCPCSRCSIICGFAG